MRSLDFPNTRSVCFPSNSMASSVIPYSSGHASTSLPKSSPISEHCESISGSGHHSGITADYVGYTVPSSSLPVYVDIAYIPSSSAQNYAYNMMNWSISDHNISAKREPASSLSHLPQQYSHYQQTPLPNDTKARAALPPSPHHRPQQHASTVIHSPVPVPASSHVPSQDPPSLSSHSTHSDFVSQSHAQRMQHLQRGHHLPMQPPALFEIDTEEWHSPHSTHQRHFPGIYSLSRSHSTPTVHGYSLPPQIQDLNDSRQQLQNERRTRSDYLSCGINDSFTMKREDSEIHAYPQHPDHAFNLSASNEGNDASHLQSPHISHSPMSVSYYSPGQPTQEEIQHSALYPEHQAYAMQSAALRPSDSSQSGYSITSTPKVGYSGEEAQYKMPEGGYSSLASGYVDVCDPRFVSNGGDEVREHGVNGVMESGCVGGETAMYISDRSMSWEDVNDDADAEADDDLEGCGSSGYTGQQDKSIQLSDSPEPPGELSEKGDDGEEEEVESDEDDSQDPEFVMRRPRRAYSASYPSTESRNLRSTRFIPYPSISPTLPSSSIHYANEVELQEQEQYQRQAQQLRSRRSYSHSNASASPPTSESYIPITADGNASTRRRARPSAVVPLPIPVPNLTKKSRGRRVPTMEEFRAESATVVKSANGRKKDANSPSSKASRTYTCDVEGCGKLFARGEHLKRHVRSIHTYEKRQFLRFSFPIQCVSLNVVLLVCSPPLSLPRLWERLQSA